MCYKQEMRTNKRKAWHHLLDVRLHVLMAEISRLWSAVAVEYSKVEDGAVHLADLKAVLVLLALADVGGTAHFGQAHHGDGLPIANAGGQQNGLVDAIVPNAEGIPGGGAAAAVWVEAGAAEHSGGRVEAAVALMQEPQTQPAGPSQAQPSRHAHGAASARAR